MLDKVAQGVAEAGGDEVGGVSKKDGGFVTCFRVAECSLFKQTQRIISLFSSA